MHENMRKRSLATYEVMAAKDRYSSQNLLTPEFGRLLAER